jgi:hypothetical protein
MHHHGASHLYLTLESIFVSLDQHHTVSIVTVTLMSVTITTQIMSGHIQCTTGTILLTICKIKVFWEALIDELCA